MRKLPADLQHHLATWISDRRHSPHGHAQIPNVDYPPRFLTPEDRWANTLVRFLWEREALVMEVDIPDVYCHQSDLLHLPSNPPLAARQELASCGLRQPTPEYREAAKAEQKEWAAAHPKAADSHPAKTVPLTHLVPDPDEKDPRGQAQLTLLAGPRTQWSAPDLLMQIARQGEAAPVVSGLQSRNAPDAGPGPSGFGTEVPKQRGQRGNRRHRQLSPRGEPSPHHQRSREAPARHGRRSLWRPCASAQAARSPGATTANAWPCMTATSSSPKPPPRRPTLVADLQARCAAGQPVPLDDLAGRMSHLNTLQWEALNQALPQLALALNWDLRLYGLLTPHQRAACATDHGLPLAGLSPAVQLAALRFSRRTHPWFTPADLKAALLRIVPCTLAVGSKGISFWIEYHHPDSPRDRDLIFTLPLELPTAAPQW